MASQQLGLLQTTRINAPQNSNSLSRLGQVDDRTQPSFVTLKSETERNIVQSRYWMRQFAPIDNNPPSQDRRLDNQQTTSEPNPPTVTGEVIAEQDVDNHTADINFRIVNTSGSAIRKVCEETYDKKLSNEIGTFDKHIRNFETTVSSIRRIHVSLDDVLVHLANLDKKPDSQPRVEDEIVNAMKEIRHELNTVMEHSFADNAQRACTIDAGN